MSLYLFDDACARGWAPFATTRPTGELLFGCLLLRERSGKILGQAMRWAAGGSGSHRIRRGRFPAGARGGFPAGAQFGCGRRRRAADLLLESSGSRLDSTPPTDAPARLVMDGQTVGWIVPPDDVSLGESDFLDPESSTLEAPLVEVGGQVLGGPWELMARNGEQVRQDIPAIFPESRFTLPEGVHCSGAERISVGSGVSLEAGVHLDATDGPIRLSDDVHVLAFTRLAGPAFVGSGTHMLGGAFQNVSIGPVCKVRGEVANSVVLGYSNKAHDGYLGHSYVGKWVNLGALTANSDLKNNYSTVRVPTARGLVDTGLIKVGCLIGDHAKTGIGTLFSTGSVVGAGSNLFGGLMSPRDVPPLHLGVRRHARRVRSRPLPRGG